jgi:hypothetical protein
MTLSVPILWSSDSSIISEEVMPDCNNNPPRLAGFFLKQIVDRPPIDFKEILAYPRKMTSTNQIVISGEVHIFQAAW